MKNDYIAVNATALSSGGALTILKQFIKHASKDMRYNYICFVPERFSAEVSDNITLINIPRMNWLERVFWDSFGLRKSLTRLKVPIFKVVSLQNTSVNIDVNQIIYLHQPLPFSNVNWNLFDRRQFKLFLYKKFYKYFILAFSNTNTEYVVQTDWMKEAVCSTLGVSRDRIYVIKPEVHLPILADIPSCLDSRQDYFYLLYPASTVFYKNHILILDAIAMLSRRRDISNLRFQVTFQPIDYPAFSQRAKTLGIESNVQYLGVLAYREMLSFYQSASVVVFPSYVETFGLPLAEAATLGKTILCSDLPYSRDVLNGYGKARYLDFKDAKKWSEEILFAMGCVGNSEENNDGYIYAHTTSWNDFFKLL